MRVLIRGVVYPSVKDAAKALNVTTVSVYRALKDDKLDTLGLGRGRSPTSWTKSKPITLNGVTYPSMRAASRALGMKPDYLMRALNSGRIAGIMARLMKAAVAPENQSKVRDLWRA